MKALMFLMVLVLGIPVFEVEAQAGGFFSRGPIRRFLFFGGPIRRRLFARRIARRMCRNCFPPRFARPPRCGNGLHRGGCNGRNFRPFVGDIIDPAQNSSGLVGGISPVSRLVSDNRSEFERIFDEAEQPQLQSLTGRTWRGVCETSSGRRRVVGPVQLSKDVEEKFREASLLRETPNQELLFRLDEETGKLAVKVSELANTEEKAFCVLE